MSMRRVVGPLVVGALAVSVVACDDNGGDAESAEVERYCQVSRQLDEAGGEIFGELDFETATPEAVAAAFTAFLDENAAAVEELEQVAPDEIRDAAEARLDSIRDVAETGDLSIEEEPEVAEADEQLREFEEDNC